MKVQDITITNKTGWMPIDDRSAPTKDSKLYDELNDKFGTSGVYQVALTTDVDEIGDELIHDKIGYTGMSKNILGRIYSIKAPSGRHGVNTYAKSNNIDKEKDLRIRYLYTAPEDADPLEKAIFKETLEAFGQRFAFTEASGGNAGNYTRFIDDANRLTVDELLEAISEIKKIAKFKNNEEFALRLEEL